MKNMKNCMNELRRSALATLSLAVLACGIYPGIVWLAGRGLFPHRAEGSFVSSQGKVLGSSLLGQGFSGDRYFHPRPSAAGAGYDAMHSGGTNLGPLSKKLLDAVRDRVVAYLQDNGLQPGTLVPADAVTASASGLDPHISIRNAQLQAKRVARVRGLSVDLILEKIKAHTEGRTLGILGEPRVNVLLLNLDLDGRL